MVIGTSPKGFAGQPPEGFAGRFESHVTVRCDDEETGALAHWALARDLKFTHIVLDQGRVVSQPMLTGRGAGTLAGFRAATEAVVADLRGAGFQVVRTKIEAAPQAEGVPTSDEEAVALGAARYFEHHLKLLLPTAAGTRALIATVAPHAAHLSRNARRVRPDGRQERFVTQRCRLVGRETAGTRLGALVAALRAERYEIIHVEREFVVFDSDESLDEGWIDEKRAPDAP